MSIKYTPKNLQNHHKYKTRRKITNTTYANKNLITETSKLLELAKKAQQELDKLNIPYINGTTVIFSSPQKIILQSDKEILKPKIAELHSQLLKMLNKHLFFDKLQKIEIHISYSSPQKINNYNDEHTQKIKQRLVDLKK